MAEPPKTPPKTSTEPIPEVPPRSPGRHLGHHGMDAVAKEGAGSGVNDAHVSSQGAPAKAKEASASAANLSSSASPAANLSSAASPTSPKDKELPAFPTLPAAPPSHRFGHGFSGRTKIPKVQDYKGVQLAHEEQSEEYQRVMNERARIMNERASVDSAKSQRSNSSVSNDIKSGKNSRDKENAHGAANEKQKMMDQMNAGNIKPTERWKHANKGERRVRDPITGAAIVVKDADPKGGGRRRTC